MITISTEKTKYDIEGFIFDKEKFLEEINSIMLEDILGQKVKLSEILKVD